jgi:uncharacterized sodium:solute symporter family permease YidK
VRNPINWLAASVFFLTGALLVAAPSVVRAVLYGQIFTRPSWQYPMETVERVVPTELRWLGVAAFVLSGLAIIIPRKE